MHLRNEELPEISQEKISAETKMHLGNKVAMVDESMDKATAVPQKTEMWRGIGERSGKKVARLNVGDVIKDAAFQSHSLNPKVAEGFASMWDKNDFKDHKTVIRAFSDGKVRGLYIGNPNYEEKEMLINRGQTWKIIGKEVKEVKIANYNKPTVYHIITVVPT